MATKQGLKRNLSATVLAFILSPLLVFLFQNCGQGFTTLGAVSSSSTSPNGNPNSSSVGSPDVPINPNGPLSVYMRSASVLQGGILSFRVALNQVSSSPIVVNLKTMDGSAVAGTDYDLYSSSVTIAPGALSASIAVQTRAYTISTSDKQMGLQITSVSSGIIGQQTSTGAISAPQTPMHFQQISAGYGYNCGITADSNVYCWGSPNIFVQTPSAAGTGTIPGLSGAKQVIVSNELDRSFACAITAQSTVMCWGTGGALGNGSFSSSNIPVAVTGLTGITQLALGIGMFCALKSDQSVWCWGNFGQFANSTAVGSSAGPNIDSAVPIQIAA